VVGDEQEAQTPDHWETVCGGSCEPYIKSEEWNPRDLRAPLLSGESVSPEMCSGDPDVAAWLRTRAHALRRAQVSLQSAREAMIRAQMDSDKPHVHAAGDLVKILTNAMRSHLDPTQKTKVDA
jgi:hypothetical protein